MPDLELEGARLVREPKGFEGEKLRAPGESRDWRLACVSGMAAFIAHRIAQPMTAINALTASSLKAVRAPTPDTAKLAGNLEKIEQQARRATDMIRAIAQFAHRTAPDIGAVDAPTIFAELAALGREAEQRGIALRFGAAPGLPGVAADPAAVVQVLSSLARNAIEAVHGGGTARREVVISAAWSDDGMVEMSVADTGPGIRPDVIPTLFDPFAPGRPEDSGVGLAVSRAIIEALGGRLGVKSSDASGVVVAFALPVVRQGDTSERRG
jgi:two-component system sensor kinase FixL